MDIEERFQRLKKEMQNSPLAVQSELEEMLIEFQAQNDTDNEFLTCLLLSDTFSNLGQYEKAWHILEPAAEIVKFNKSQKQQAKLYNSYGTLYWYQGDYSKALQEYIKLMKIADELKDDRLLFNAYNNIGMIYWIEEKYQEAVELYNKGYKLIKDPNSHDAANTLNNIGICYIKLKDYNKALHNLHEALTIFEKENDLKLMANSILNIANIYHETSNPVKALKYMEKVLKIKRKIDDRWGICHCLSSLAQIYLTTGRFEDSREALEEALPLSIELGAKDLSKGCYKVAVLYYQAIGDYKKAFENYQEYIKVEDEIKQAETQKQIAELQKNFELMEKEKETEIFKLRNIELKNKNDLILKQKKKLDAALKELKELNINLQRELNSQLEQLRQKDQMLSLQSKQASMGEMLSCIAHQWKQPLNGISIITQNLMDTWEYNEFSEEFLYKNCGSLLDLVNFMSATINDFRDFFKPELEAYDFNLKDIVQKTLLFVEKSLEQSKIDIKMDLNDVSAHGFPNYYSQVVMNILNNARDVLEERKIKQPWITIKTFNSPRSKKAILTIEDNGGGIIPGNIKKIFNPYFSTKSSDKGTGLGLYMSKVIIENNMHGKLLVKNTSAGACFRVEL